MVILFWARVTFQCRAPEDADITISTLDEFDTVAGCSGTIYDSQIAPNTITIRQVPKPCTSDLECDDGSYCSGTEFCDIGGTDTCQIGLPVDCDDGISCTDDSCNETTASCENIPLNYLCSNPFFCDGEETCDPINGCQPGIPVTCPEGQICDEDLNQCVEPLPCSVIIMPSSATVFTWETRFNSVPLLTGHVMSPAIPGRSPPGGCTVNTTGSSIGSTIDANGLYMADGMLGTDVVRVIDECNGNICDSATVHVISFPTTTTTTPIPCIPDSYEPDNFPPEVKLIAPDSCQYRSICLREMKTGLSLTLDCRIRNYPLKPLDRWVAP